MENSHLFSSSLPRLDKRHETSQIFPRTEQTFASARSFGVISWASFSRKNGPFGFERAPSASQKALSKSKGTFLWENDTKTLELSKSAEGNGEYLWSSVAFVKAWIKCNFPRGKICLKTTQILNKNKAWCIRPKNCVKLAFVPPLVWKNGQRTQNMKKEDH